MYDTTPFNGLSITKKIFLDIFGKGKRGGRFIPLAAFGDWELDYLTFYLEFRPGGGGGERRSTGDPLCFMLCVKIGSKASLLLDIIIDDDLPIRELVTSFNGLVICAVHCVKDSSLPPFLPSSFPGFLGMGKKTLQ